MHCMRPERPKILWLIQLTISAASNWNGLCTLLLFPRTNPPNEFSTSPVRLDCFFSVMHALADNDGSLSRRLGNPTHSAYPEPAHPELVLPRLAILILSPPIIALLIHALLALTLSILSPPKPAYLKLEPALPESAHAKPAHPECAQPNDPTPSASSGHNLPSSVDIPGVRQVSKTCMTPVWGELHSSHS